MEVLSLLQSENRCLEKLLAFSRQFVQSARAQDWSGLENFDRRRQIFFKTLDLIDRRLTDAAEKVSSIGALPTAATLQLKVLLEERKNVISQILESDASLAALLERESQAASSEVREARKSRETLSKFKSSWVPVSGSEMDRQV